MTVNVSICLTSSASISADVISKSTEGSVILVFPITSTLSVPLGLLSMLFFLSCSSIPAAAAALHNITAANNVLIITVIF